MFLAPAIIDAAIPERGRRERAPQAGLRYLAAVDPAAGGADAFSLAVCHGEGVSLERRIVQDVRRASRFKPSALSDLRGVVEQIVRIATGYGCTEVTGDRFAKGWVREAFAAHGIRCRDAVRPDGRPLTKAEAYLKCEAYFAEGRISFLDDPTQTAELKGLQRRPVPGGRSVVDHRSGTHDDAANVTASSTATG